MPSPIATPLSKDDHKPWRQKCGAPLEPCDQLLVDGLRRANVQWVREAIMQGANPTLALCRIGQSLYSSPMGLAVCQEKSDAQWMLGLFQESRTVSRRDLFQDFMIHASLHASDELIAWFLDCQRKSLAVAEQGSALRILSSRNRWSAIVDCRDHLWRWESLHAGVNCYTAAFVWVRALLSSHDHAEIIRTWVREVLLRFERVDALSCKTALDELALHCADHEDGKIRHRVVNDLVQLLQSGSAMGEVPRPKVNPWVGVLLDEACARMASERAASLLEQDTAVSGSSGCSGRGRL